MEKNGNTHWLQHVLQAGAELVHPSEQAVSQDIIRDADPTGSCATFSPWYKWIVFQGHRMREHGESPVLRAESM